MLYNSDIMHPRNRILLSGLAVLVFAVGGPAMAHAASYDLVANKETFVVGDSFTVDLKVNSADVGINAAQATLSFPKGTVQVTGVDKTNSVFNFWLQGPDYSNDAGTVSFIGGNQNGIAGTDLEVLRVTFKVKGAGPVALVFTDGAVTASDGSGTNVLSAMNGLQLTSITTQDAALIKPPQIVRPAVPTGVLPVKPNITVPLYPDPAAWYARISKFIVQWSLPKDVTALLGLGRDQGVSLELLRGVLAVNHGQAQEMLNLIERHVPSLSGVTVTVLGLAFKPDTDDVRESPALPLIRALKARGARLTAYDPVARPASRDLENVRLASSLREAVADADVVALVTRWPEFATLASVLDEMGRQPLVVDGRRCLEPARFARYAGIGRG